MVAAATVHPKINYTRPPLYAKQRAFVDSPERYTIVEASTKTGKTVACLVWLFERALAGKPGQNFWWVAPIYSTAGIAFERLKTWLKGSGLPDDVYKLREADQALEIAGRVIWFKGADRPDTLYGEDVHAAVFDEATRAKPEAWYALRSTLTATRGPVKVIGNVRGRHNWAYTLARRAESGAPNHAYFKLTAWDAVEGGVLAKEEVEDAKATLPDNVFKELYLAEPSDDGGNPFGLKAIAACTMDGLSTKDPVVWGADLAKSVDWNVLVGLDEDDRVCRLERWQSDWGATKQRIIDTCQGVPLLADSTGVGDPVVEDLQRSGLNVEGFKFTSGSKQQLMEGLAAAIQQEAVHFPEGWLVNELEAFEFEYRQNGVRYSAPAGLHDDGVMGLALAWRKRGRGIDMSIFEDGAGVSVHPV